MSLNLDARQRAMLQEMGVTVWTRAETPAPQTPNPTPPAVATVAAPTATPQQVAPTMAQPLAPAAQPGPAPAAKAPAAPAPVAPAPSVGLGASAAPVLRLHPPQPLYPTADPAQTPAGLGAGWLIVTEGIAAADPLGGDAGKLLDNMLRAMQLHRHPRVHRVDHVAHRFACARGRAGTHGRDGGDRGHAQAVVRYGHARILGRPG